MKFLVKPVLFILSLPLFSRMYGRITRIRRPRFLSRFMINLFTRTYNISMSDYVGDTSDYGSLAEIFIRKLDPEKRKLETDSHALLSPADGVISSVELADSTKVIQVKGIEYDLTEFLNKQIDMTRKWYVTTIYLSPKDYHRYHFPVSGSVTGYCHMRGRLFPVNQLGLNNIKSLFIRNERIVLELRHGPDPVYIGAVGATFVGSIKMEFIHKYRRDSRWKEISLNAAQMSEMGRFELGSTIVMVTPESLGKPVAGITGKHVSTGEKLFSLNA
jgi:phosphatidylserine decarboxylase